MKKFLFFMLIILSIVTVIAIETELTADEAQGLENYIKANLVKEYDEIKAGALTELSQAKFYRVNVLHKYNSYNQTDEIVIVNFNGEYSELKSINDLTKYIDPTYKINSLEDTETFAMAAKELFPSWYSSFRDGIYQEGSEWFFIYSKFFDEKDGIVVTVDEDGKISSIETRGGIK